MSKFTDQLREIGIYNATGYADGKGIIISFVTQGNSRSGITVEWGWHVWSPNRKVESIAPWYRSSFAKVFPLHRREDKVPQLVEALDWAREKYKIISFTKTPFGDWMDAEFVEKRNAELKKKILEYEDEQKIQRDN